MRAALGRLAHRLFPGMARSLCNARILAYAQGQARGEAVDAAGRPVPWYTYPAIEYLGQFDWRAASVFEFGSGNSTRFWAARAKRVCAVESDPDWHGALAAQAIPALEIFLRPDKTGYVACLAEQRAKFDLIIVDGRWRRAG
jgi:hypothetical protein